MQRAHSICVCLNPMWMLGTVPYSPTVTCGWESRCTCTSNGSSCCMHTTNGTNTITTEATQATDAGDRHKQAAQSSPACCCMLLLLHCHMHADRWETGVLVVAQLYQKCVTHLLFILFWLLQVLWLYWFWKQGV